GVEVGQRFRLAAIGSPDGLLSAMERPGGVIAQLEQFINATIVARQSNQIVVPPTASNLVPSVAEAIR
ncbi:MAG TPA: hypothetical protein VK838_00345, partial [Candidatus Limnocylindrales bacterium]|nr:hypothetical protein [Candidatus Limnocylindrales bacterium]